MHENTRSHATGGGIENAHSVETQLPRIDGKMTI